MIPPIVLTIIKVAIIMTIIIVLLRDLINALRRKPSRELEEYEE